MYCTNCGANLPDGTKYCSSCGTPVGAPQRPMQVTYAQQNYIPYQQPENPTGKGLAIASLVLGIIGVVNMGSLVFSLVGLILGCVARGKGYKKGIGTAGIVLGIVGMIFGLVVVGLFSMIIYELVRMDPSGFPFDDFPANLSVLAHLFRF